MWFISRITETDYGCEERMPYGYLKTILEK